METIVCYFFWVLNIGTPQGVIKRHSPETNRRLGYAFFYISSVRETVAHRESLGDSHTVLAVYQTFLLPD